VYFFHTHRTKTLDKKNNIEFFLSIVIFVGQSLYLFEIMSSITNVNVGTDDRNVVMTKTPPQPKRVLACPEQKGPHIAAKNDGRPHVGALPNPAGRRLMFAAPHRG
jgi:hypothetical protein